MFILYPLAPWLYVLKQLEASFMIARRKENPEHVNNKPGISRPPITTTWEDTSLVRIARQWRYAASKTIRNLRNLGRPTASGAVRNRPRRADCVHEDLPESNYPHNGTERYIKMKTRTISACCLLADWMIFSVLMVRINNHQFVLWPNFCSNMSFLLFFRYLG